MPMTTSERRFELVRILKNRRYDRTENLAFEFNVSEKTVRRDIDAISRVVPVYTKRGRHGGVYLLGSRETYMSDSELGFLRSLADRCNPTEKTALANIIGKYSRPAA